VSTIDDLRLRVRRLVATKVAYNVVEAIVAISAGSLASSSALIGFGLDGVIEVISSLAIAWQFAGGRNHSDRERPALRFIALSFFGLAAFVSFDAIRTLADGSAPKHSTAGIVLAIVSLIVMPGLATLQRRTGRELGSASVVADSRQTLICAALSAVLLVGLATNSVFGWTWADPLAALAIAAVALREGIRAWRGDTCCTPASAMFANDDVGACVDDACYGSETVTLATTARGGNRS
jgi:divalent metal cation (Fe/Co/Zn/Cd) transporter